MIVIEDGWRVPVQDAAMTCFFLACCLFEEKKNPAFFLHLQHVNETADHTQRICAVKN
jgi:hypothetical protein